MKKLEKTLTEAEVLLHRQDDCENYDECLDKAAMQQWRSFSCIGCAEYRQSCPILPQIRKTSSLQNEHL